MFTAKVFAPGTIANVGPGFDCLGLCLDGMGDLVTVGPSPSGVDEVVVTGRDASFVPLEFEGNCASITAAAVRRSLGRPDPMRVEIERSLPLSGGLGASAAASVGGALAAAHAFGLQPTMNQLLLWALEGEEVAAGRHLDNIAPCLWGGLTLSFFAEAGALCEDPPEPIVRSFEPNHLRPLWLAIVTPRIKVKTRAAREILPHQVTRRVYEQGIARTAAVTAAFLSGDWELLAHGIEDPFAVPVRKSLVPGFDRALAVAKKAGALGLGISGSGPTLFAPCLSLDAASDVSEGVSAVFREMGASAHVCGIASPSRVGSDRRVAGFVPNEDAAQNTGGAHCVSLITHTQVAVAGDAEKAKIINGGPV